MICSYIHRLMPSPVVHERLHPSTNGNGDKDPQTDISLSSENPTAEKEKNCENQEDLLVKDITRKSTVSTNLN